MSEQELQDLLLDLFQNGGDLGELSDNLRDCETFSGGGVLSSNKGLTLYMGDGSEFQLTLVRSR